MGPGTLPEHADPSTSGSDSFVFSEQAPVEVGVAIQQ